MIAAAALLPLFLASSAHAQDTEVFRLSADLSVVICTDAELIPIPAPEPTPTPAPTRAFKGRDGGLHPVMCATEALLPRTREIVLTESQLGYGDFHGQLELERVVDGLQLRSVIRVNKYPLNSDPSYVYYLDADLFVNGVRQAGLSMPTGSDMLLRGVTLTGTDVEQSVNGKVSTYTAKLYLAPPMTFEPIPNPTATATSIPMPSPMPTSR